MKQTLQGQGVGLGRSALLLLVASLTASACGGPVTRTIEGPDGSAPVGQLIVNWRIVSVVDGSELTCAEVGISEVSVRLGGEPETVLCENGSRTYDGLLAQRYPVLVELKLGAVTLADGRTNVEVVAEDTATVTVDIPIQPRNLNKGSVVIRWRINGMPATAQCAAIDGQIMQVRSDMSSASEISMQASCVDAAIMFEDVEPGRYFFILRLVDSNGDFVAGNSTQPFDVRPNEVAEPDTVPIVTELQDPGRIVGLYTINGTTAASQCSAIGAETVSIDVRVVDQMTGGTRLADTQTASCTAGRVTAIGLNTELYSADIRLKGPFGGTITSTIVSNIALRRGETATVAVDFMP